MSVILPDGLMVSVSGIRGRVGAPLTPELVAAVAAHFGAFLKQEGKGNHICVGRDSRTSGPMFEAAVVGGLQSVGCEVTALGIVPTPTLLLAVEDHGAAGGIGVTASHNPAEWNALKLASSDGMFLDSDVSGRFRDFLDGGEPERAPWDALGSVSADRDAVGRHLQRILALPHLDLDGLGRRRFTVALDCVRGAGGVMVPELLQRLGCRVAAIHTEPDGRFPRDPEPTAENLAELGELVRSSGADVGLAVDPDVDRLSLVDEEGRPLGEDLTLALAADVVLRRTSGPVVTNLSTSQVLEDVARSHGVDLVRAPVGEINVARRMQAEDAVIAGEGNGGVILPEIHGTRDAPVGVALILQYLLDVDEPLSRAVGKLPSYAIVKEKLGFPGEALDGAYEALEDVLSPREVDRADGLRLTWPGRKAWLHVRPSGTEPVVRLIAEAPDEAGARELVTRARGVLQGVL